MEEDIVALYPRVSYGVPLDEIATAPEISSVMAKTTEEVPNEGTLPSEPVQEKDPSNSDLSLENIAASILENEIKLSCQRKKRISCRMLW